MSRVLPRARPPELLWTARVVCAPEQVAAFESLLGKDALSVSVLAPPRRKEALVEAVFAAPPSRARLESQSAILALLHPSAPPPRLTIEKLGNLDWLKKVAADFPPVLLGRWTAHGGAHRPPPGRARLALRIDASSAFGTGEHPTTRGCLLALDTLLKKTRPRRLLDVGCGSGILALALARAAPTARSIGVDLDPVAVAIARANARINRLAPRARFVPGHGYTAPAVRAARPFDLVMANIFAGPLCRMARDLRAHLSAGGSAILSGILAHQANAVLAAHRRQGLVLERRTRLGEWSVLLLRRPTACQKERR